MSSQICCLHLSDIHYMVGPDSENMRNNLYQGLELYFKNANNTRVDCIVLTGDFFQQGQYISDSKSCVDFIEEVCRKCLKDDRKDEWRKHVFFCPGNHDLNRDSSFNNVDRNETISRTTALKRAKTASPHYMMGPEKDEYDFLVNDSFWLFNRVINSEITGEKNYGEYHLFCEELVDNDTCYKIFFVGINTALYAGQIREKADIKADIAQTRQTLFDAEKACFPDYSIAKDTYARYLRLHNELVNVEANDIGKLCFISDKSSVSLKRDISVKSDQIVNPFVLFLGHHPLEWLTEEARKRFAIFAKNYCNKAIYLCGHEHKPKVNDVEVPFINDDPYHVVELEVGGEFPDKSEWNSLSFSIYTLTFGDNESVKLNGTIGCWCRYVDNTIIAFAKAMPHAHGWQFVDFGDITLRDAASVSKEMGNQYRIEQDSIIKTDDKFEGEIKIINETSEGQASIEAVFTNRDKYANDILGSINIDF